MKGIIEKIICDKEVTIQDIMTITCKSITTIWKCMQKLIDLDVVIMSSQTNNVIYKIMRITTNNKIAI